MSVIPRNCSPGEVERACLAEKVYCHLFTAEVHLSTEHGTEVVPLVDVLRAVQCDPKDDDNPDIARPGQWETS